MKRSIGMWAGAACAMGFITPLAAADVIIGNYQAGVGTGTVFGTSATTIYKAVGWTMPSQDFRLDEVRLSLNFGLLGTGIFSIWSGSGVPQQRLINLVGPPQTGAGTFTFTPQEPFILAAGQTYWLYVESIPNPTGQFTWDGTSPSTVPTGLATYVAYIFNGNPSSFFNRFEVIGSPVSTGCYPNCDQSTVQPILNIDDFTCFINEFATAQTLPHPQQITSYANCDGSTTAPVLNIDDFTCFINEFATGCP